MNKDLLQDEQQNDKIKDKEKIAIEFLSGIGFYVKTASEIKECEIM